MKHSPKHTILRAGALRDAAGTDLSPGSVLIQSGRIAAVGHPDDMPSDLVGEVRVIDRSDHLILPQMVNAHTHLELTDIGPRPYDPVGGFVGWVQQIRAHAPTTDSARRAALQRGAAMARRAGVFAVGDVASSIPLADARRDAGLLGTSYLELFGLGSPFDRDALDALGAIERADDGLQPHAPYSAGPSLFAAAAKSGKPVSTHLAETVEESRFVGQGDGPWLDYLRSIGRWDDAFEQHVGQGLSPVQWMRPHLRAAADRGGWLVAHCNYVGDDDLAILAESNASVAYCPIASEYFGHVGHRYRDMLDAGVNVCLGTDSIVGTDPRDPQQLGLISAMRRLYERDGFDPQTLLAMATVNGARALRLDDPNAATLRVGADARFIALPIDRDSSGDPLVQTLTRQDPAEAISLVA
ncbi:MAG: amidohydrolase family protein [Phycisphaeraceae bacterium]